MHLNGNRARFFSSLVAKLLHALSEIEIRNYSARKKESCLHWLWARPDSIRIFGSKRNNNKKNMNCRVLSAFISLKSIVFARIALSPPFDRDLRSPVLSPSICDIRIYFFQILHRRSSFILILFPVDCADHFPYISTPSVHAVRGRNDEFDHVKIKYVPVRSLIVFVPALFFGILNAAAFRSLSRQITNELRTVTSRRFRMTFKSIKYIFIVLGRIAFGGESRWSVDLAKYRSLVVLSRKHHVHRSIVMHLCIFILRGCPVWLSIGVRNQIRDEIETGSEHDIGHSGDAFCEK